MAGNVALDFLKNIAQTAMIRISRRNMRLTNEPMHFKEHSSSTQSSRGKAAKAMGVTIDSRMKTTWAKGFIHISQQPGLWWIAISSSSNSIGIFRGMFSTLELLLLVASVITVSLSHGSQLELPQPDCSFPNIFSLPVPKLLELDLSRTSESLWQLVVLPLLRFFRFLEGTWGSWKFWKASCWSSTSLTCGGLLIGVGGTLNCWLDVSGVAMKLGCIWWCIWRLLLSIGRHWFIRGCCWGNWFSRAGISSGIGVFIIWWGKLIPFDGIWNWLLLRWDIRLLLATTLSIAESLW